MVFESTTCSLPVGARIGMPLSGSWHHLSTDDLRVMIAFGWPLLANLAKLGFSLYESYYVDVCLFVVIFVVYWAGWMFKGGEYNVEYASRVISAGMSATSILLPSSFLGLVLGIGQRDGASQQLLSQLPLAVGWFVLSVFLGVLAMNQLPLVATSKNEDDVVTANPVFKRIASPLLNGCKLKIRTNQNSSSPERNHVAILVAMQFFALFFGTVRLLVAAFMTL